MAWFVEDMAGETAGGRKKKGACSISASLTLFLFRRAGWDWRRGRIQGSGFRGGWDWALGGREDGSLSLLKKGLGRKASSLLSEKEKKEGRRRISERQAILPGRQVKGRQGVVVSCLPLLLTLCSLSVSYVPMCLQATGSGGGGRQASGALGMAKRISTPTPNRKRSPYHVLPRGTMAA